MSADSPEYINGLASRLNSQINTMMGEDGRISTVTALVLCALNALDEGTAARNSADSLLAAKPGIRSAGWRARTALDQPARSGRNWRNSAAAAGTGAADFHCFGTATAAVGTRTAGSVGTFDRRGILPAAGGGAGGCGPSGTGGGSGLPSSSFQPSETPLSKKSALWKTLWRNSAPPARRRRSGETRNLPPVGRNWLTHGNGFPRPNRKPAAKKQLSVKNWKEKTPC